MKRKERTDDYDKNVYPPKKQKTEGKTLNIPLKKRKPESSVNVPVKIKLAEGFYEGAITRERKRHGYGVMIYTQGENKGTKYEGQWVDDKQEGNGKYFKKNGQFFKLKYEGCWKKGSYSGKGTYYRKNGDKYEGSFRNGVFSGYGIYISANGARYEGQWRNDSEHGKGKEYHPNGKLKYRGIWNEGIMWGMGKLFFENGDVQYEGKFKRGLFHGRGKLHEKNGDSYDGNFEEGKKNGKGVYFVKETGERYIGGWKNDKKHGLGEIVDSHKRRILSGKWVNDQLQTVLGVANDTLGFPNGDVYKGTLKSGSRSGKFNGAGMLLDKSGNWFKGKFIRGKEDGFGTLHFTNGVIYEGEWIEGVPSGKGKIFQGGYRNPPNELLMLKQKRLGKEAVDSSKELPGRYETEFFKNRMCVNGVDSLFGKFEGLFYSGDWKNGKFHGKGVMRYGNSTEAESDEADVGYSYSGEWENGKRSGKGIGCVPKGEWIEVDAFEGGSIVETYFVDGLGGKFKGKLVEGRREGHGTYWYVNGDRFVGRWRNNQRHGKGIMYYGAGGRFEGEWVNDRELSLE